MFLISEESNSYVLSSSGPTCLCSWDISVSRGRTGRRPSLTASHERVCLASTSSPGSGSCPSSGKRYDAERRVLRRGAVRLEEVGQTVHREADADKMLFSNYRFRCLFALWGWRPWRGRGVCVFSGNQGLYFKTQNHVIFRLRFYFPKKSSKLSHLRLEPMFGIFHNSSIVTVQLTV